jgi:hypothetical protein
MSINKTRGFLYTIAKLLGDFQAVSSGSPKKDRQTGGQENCREGHGKGLPEAVQVTRY